jgi:hypothetical protein
MGKFTIINVTPSMDRNTGAQYVDNYGNKSWSAILQDEQSQTTSVLMRRKSDSLPKVGDVIEGTIETKDSASGKKYSVFKAAMKEHSFGGRTPEERFEIIRQSSLQRANEFFYYTGNSKYTKEDLVGLAEYLANYVKGGIKDAVKVDAEEIDLSSLDSIPF